LVVRISQCGGLLNSSGDHASSSSIASQTASKRFTTWSSASRSDVTTAIHRLS